MVEGKSLGVVIPAYNEERLIAVTLAGIPAFVERILVVDDRSTDGTVTSVRACMVDDPRIRLVEHSKNGGVGAAIVTGYQVALDEGLDLVAVMGADNQMDPAELESLARPVAEGYCDYAKANRLTTPQAIKNIPKVRFFGNAILSMLTKIASGYWHVADSQAGYTVISAAALRRIDLQGLYRRYGFPNDLLIHLNVARCVVLDVPSRPIYGVGEESGIRLRRVMIGIPILLFRRFWWRMWSRYVVLDFHPLVFFYAFGSMLLLGGGVLGTFVVVRRIEGFEITAPTIVLVALMLISGLQLAMFAMWFDMEAAPQAPSKPTGTRDRIN